MQQLSKQITIENLHHFYLIDRDFFSKEDLRKILQEKGIVYVKNPDVTEFSYELFSIDDARYIKIVQQEKSVVGDRRYIIIESDTVSREAQHALLKIFEEPVYGVHIFFITRRIENIIETLRSRAYICTGNTHSTKQQEEKGNIFLELSFAERIAMIKKDLKNIQIDKTPQASRMYAHNLLNDIESAVYIHWKKNKHTVNVCNELWNAHMYLQQNGSPVKIILEHIALIL